jgi:transposase
MEKNDGRSVSHEMLEQIRIQAVRRVLAGENPEETMRLLGLNRACIYKWLSVYKEKGAEGLRAKSIAGRPPKLAPESARRLKETLSALHEGKFAQTAYVWNVRSVRELANDEYNVDLSEKTIERFMNRAGILSQNDINNELFVNSAADSFLRLKQLSRETDSELFVYAEKITRSKSNEEETLYLALPVQGYYFFMLHKGRPKTCAMTGFIERFSERLKEAEQNAILAIDRSKYDIPPWATRHIASVCDAVRVEFL